MTPTENGDHDMTCQAEKFNEALHKLIREAETTGIVLPPSEAGDGIIAIQFEDGSYVDFTQPLVKKPATGR